MMIRTHPSSAFLRNSYLKALFPEGLRWWREVSGSLHLVTCFDTAASINFLSELSLPEAYLSASPFCITAASTTSLSALNFAKAY